MCLVSEAESGTEFTHEACSEALCDHASWHAMSL